MYEYQNSRYRSVLLGTLAEIGEVLRTLDLTRDVDDNMNEYDVQLA